MNSTGYIHKRRSKYMAQILEKFETDIEPLLPAEAAGAVADFKGLVRARVNALAVDAVDVCQSLERGVALNGAGQDMRDQVDPVGRP